MRIYNQRLMIPDDSQFDKNVNLKRISFCSDQHLDRLLTESATKHRLNRSLLIRSILLDFLDPIITPETI
jgi:hypothetical protein